MPAYQPPPSPPSIVQNPPLRLVQLPISVVTEGGRAVTAVRLALCSNFSEPHGRRSPEYLAHSDEMDARHCHDVVQDAVRSGTISDVAAMALALRSIPFTDPQGGDNVDRTMDDVAARIATVPVGTKAFDYYLHGLDQSQLVRKPFTMDEMKAVTIRDGRTATPSELTPLRSIPIDPSTAYVFTAADVVAHPARYTAEGMTLAQTIADARTRHSAVDDAKIIKSCFDNDGVQGVHECQMVAARETSEMVVKGEFKPYDPELYGAARIAATDPRNYITDPENLPHR
jgi:hypothetical protein